MLQVDVLTSFVISGAGSLVAAAMTALVRPDERHLREGLHICSLAFVVVGIGLFQVVLGVETPDDLQMFIAMTATTLGVALFTWGLSRLSNVRVSRAPTLAVLAGVLALFVVARAIGGWAVSHTFVAASTALSLLAVVLQRELVLRPANRAERLLGLAVVAFAASWVLRAALSLQYTGPQLLHHVHVPGVAIPFFATFYGVMPIFLATVVLNLINARLSQRLETRAMTDELTGVMTRRALSELAPAAISRARRGGGEVAVLMLDIDRFKAVNDRHGHLVGDEVLRQIARTLGTQLRPDALLTRSGGEEFAAVVPVADLASARQVAERLRFAVAERACRCTGLELTVTISVGMTMLGPAEPLEAGVLRADQALYRAKNAGRNRVEASLVATA